MIERLDGIHQRPHRAHLQAGDDARLGGVLRWQEHAAQAEPPCGDGNRQDAANAVDAAVE
jgi:hypothetical protein